MLFFYHFYSIIFRYLDLFSTQLYLTPMLLRNVGKTKCKLRPILNKINKNNKKEYSRVIGKISHNQPITVFSDIVNRTTKVLNLLLSSSSSLLLFYYYIIIFQGGYDSLIELYVNCFNYCTNLSLDVIGFIIFRSLLDYKGKIFDLKSCTPSI